MGLSEHILTLHEDPFSGNCYKIRLTANLLGITLQSRQYDLMRGDTQTPNFISNINSFGRIPVLQIGPADFVHESNAACLYLGEGTFLVPSDRRDRAEMYRWMFFEQNFHEPTIATLRFWKQRSLPAGKLGAAQISQIPEKQKSGEIALNHMEQHLRSRLFFVDDSITLADIMLYAYTHVAGESGYDMEKWPSISAWCRRVESTPGYCTMS